MFMCLDPNLAEFGGRCQKVMIGVGISYSSRHSHRTLSLTDSVLTSRKPLSAKHVKVPLSSHLADVTEYVSTILRATSDQLSVTSAV